MSETTSDARSEADPEAPAESVPVDSAAAAAAGGAGGTPTTDRPNAAPQRRWRAGLAAAAVTMAVAAVALGLLAASLWGQLADERDERAEVSRVAGTMAAALLTYDYEDLDAARERVLSLSTGKFRTEYRTAFEGLRTLLSEAKASSRGTVTDVYLSREEGEPTAAAIVVVNTVAEGTAGRRATVASYIQLDLVKVDGEWKVDGVTNLNFGSTPIDIGGGSEAPSTSAPAGP